MNYMISYDLRKSGKDYEAIFEKIKSISTAYCPTCLSTFVISTNLSSATAVYQAIISVMDENDYLIVAEITKDICARLEKENADFISKYFM